jgi:hypothetical protein
MGKEFRPTKKLVHIFNLISHAFRLVKCLKYNCKLSATFKLKNNFSQRSFV